MPVPPPPGLPPCVALGEYGGVLREALLAYKERGRHGLGRPLGGLLAECVAAAVDGGSRVLLVPVPTTAKAIRARHGDHARRLARQAAARLRRAGVRAEVAQPLRALPRPDSAGLDAATRAAVAAGAIKLRPARAAAVVRSGSSAGTAVVLVDDIVTTGATLAAAATTLRAAGIRVRAAVVLAATRRRVPSIPG
jgi:predicted amidophosphoribosyltransferase